VEDPQVVESLVEVVGGPSLPRLQTPSLLMWNTELTGLAGLIWWFLVILLVIWITENALRSKH
jgi:hypothetical protein